MLYNITVSFWYISFALLLTYLVWGFIIAFEVVLAMGGSKWATEWLRTHHSYRQLYAEVLLFYPMILLGYLFLELIPHYVFGASKPAPFEMQNLFERLFGK